MTEDLAARVAKKPRTYRLIAGFVTAYALVALIFGEWLMAFAATSVSITWIMFADLLDALRARGL